MRQTKHDIGQKLRSPLRILLLGPLPPPYMGPAIATEILLKSKLSELFEIIHIDTNVHRSLRTLGVLSLDLLWRNANAYRLMIKKMLLKRPDIVLIPISQTTAGFLKDSIYILLGILFRRTIVLQLRGGNFMQWFNSAPGAVQWYAKKIMKRTSSVIVLGNNLRRQFAPFYQDDKIFVVPNGADYDVLPSEDRNNAAISILYLANLQPSKGIEDLLAAISTLKQVSHLHIRTDVAGSWLDDKTRLRCLDFIRNNQLDVVFHEAVTGKAKWDLLRQADIFVFPPREPEGHPWVIIEAMASGLPIISTDMGAISESVIDGLNGFIVGQRNPEEIAEKISLLAGNPELRKKMGMESRRLYENNFTEEKMVERLANALNTVLSDRCAV